MYFIDFVHMFSIEVSTVPSVDASSTHRVIFFEPTFKM